MKKWKNNGFDMKFISSCQIQAEISSNRHIFQNFQISKPSALKNPGSGPLKISSPGHEKTRHMPCSPLLPRMISRLVHGNEVEFHARHENLNYMPGMKSDDIEATARKRGAFHARHENLNVMPGVKSVET